MDQNNEPYSIKNDRKGPALWGWPTFLSIAVAMVILAAAASFLDLRAIWREIAACDKQAVIIGALAHYGTYFFRGLRWRRCLVHLPVTAGNSRFGLLVFFYNFVDNLVPAKLGDVYGAHLARINFGIRRSAAMGSIVFMRMIDSWVVLVLASLASWILFSASLPPSVVWSLIGGGIIAVGVTSVLLAVFYIKKAIPGWLPQKIQSIIQSFNTGMWPRPKEMLPIAILTLIIWALETLWVFCLTLAFGLRMGIAEIVFLTMIPLLATAFPFTPSGVGVVEITLYSCLRVVGVSTPIAGSLTVVNRFLDYWLHIGLGVAIWALRRVIGLRTWRDVPMGDFPATDSPEMTVDPGVTHDN